MEKRKISVKINFKTQNNISSGLLFWFIKMKKIEKILQNNFNTPELFCFYFSIKLSLYMNTTNFIYYTYFLIKSSRKRFAQLIEDLNFIEKFLMNSLDKMLFEISLFMFESIDSFKNIENLVFFENMFASLMNLWIKIKEISQYKILLQTSSKDLKLFFESFFQRKKNETIGSFDFGKNHFENFNNFKDVWNVCYLKLIKLVFLDSIFYILAFLWF